MSNEHIRAWVRDELQAAIDADGFVSRSTALVVSIKLSHEIATIAQQELAVMTDTTGLAVLPVVANRPPLPSRIVWRSPTGDDPRAVLLSSSKDPVSWVPVERGTVFVNGVRGALVYLYRTKAVPATEPLHVEPVADDALQSPALIDFTLFR